MKVLHYIAFILVIIGALDWGLIGLGGFVGADWDLINFVLASWPQVEWLIYVLVGLSGVYLIFTHKKDCKMCSASTSTM